MKGYCEGLVMLHYATALGLEPMERFESKSAKERIVSERVQNLIGQDTTFHYGPNDELVGFFIILLTRFLTRDQGKKSNLTHECIAQMCINFYYGSAGGNIVLARCFPADFKHTVPEYAIAIVATCVSRSYILDFCLTFS
jgi:hypothetical protein